MKFPPSSLLLTFRRGDGEPGETRGIKVGRVSVTWSFPVREGLDTEHRGSLLHHSVFPPSSAPSFMSFFFVVAVVARKQTYKKQKKNNAHIDQILRTGRPVMLPSRQRFYFFFV